MSAVLSQATSDSPHAAWQQGQSLRLSGKPAEALKVLRQALTAESRDYRLHDEVGMCLVELKRPEEAIGSFLMAVNLQPDFADAYNKIGSAFASRGMYEPAAHWFLQARKLNSTDTKYLYAYGCALVQLDSREEAAKVFDQWVKADPENPIARHLAGAMMGSQSIAKASPDYICALFDGFSTQFDEKLEILKYRGPELVLRALTRAATPPANGWTILDAGSGTGLVGAALKPFASRLVGVDLSAGMMEVARQRAIYDELVHCDIVDHLRQCTREFDVITASDLLTYIGDVVGFFEHAAHALRPGGRVVVVAEALKTTEDFQLNPTGRFSQSRHFLTTAMTRAGLTVASLEEDVMRHEGSKPVPSWVAVGVASDK